MIRVGPQRTAPTSPMMNTDAYLQVAPTCADPHVGSLPYILTWWLDGKFPLRPTLFRGAARQAMFAPYSGSCEPSAPALEKSETHLVAPVPDAGRLKIAIIGTGVAGSYLLNRIPPEHEVEAFEMREKEKWWAVCAWGTSAPFISDLVKKAGLNFEDYILFRGKRMIVDPGNGGRDIRHQAQRARDVRQDEAVRGHEKGEEHPLGLPPKDINELKGFDMVIDATGFHRSLMPRLEHDAAIPCFEVEVEGKFPWDDFYIKPYPGLSGYFWYFPLGEGRGHIGAGDFKAQYRGEIEEMIKKYDWKVVRRIGRPVRILAPSYMGPFYKEPKCLTCGKTIDQHEAPEEREQGQLGPDAGATN